MHRTIRSAAVCLAATFLAACAHNGPTYHSFFRDERVQTIPEADYRQPLTRIELAYADGYYAANSWRASNQAYGRARPYVNVDVGNPTPVVAWSNKPLGEANRRPFVPYAASSERDTSGVGRDWSGQWTMQLTLPVTFYLFWDAFTDNNPIVDTDYTFGFDLSGRIAFKPLTEQRFGVYWGHISTHLGDEYVISGRQAGVPFPRVNVSMFPWHVNASHRRYFEKAMDGAHSYWQISGQLEGPCVKCNGTGYYYTYPSETDGVVIPMIKPGLEFTGGFDLRILRTLFQVNSPAARANLEAPSMNFGLVVGNRRIFPYLPTTSATYGLSLNGDVGYRFPATVGAGVNYVEVYLRGYRGPNPYGQLRNQSNFKLVSVGAKILH